MTAVVVGIGQHAAGDDGVGLVVARVLAERGLETREAADASVVLALLEAEHRIVLIDAVVGGGAPGSVLQLDPRALDSNPTPLSSHGIGVAEALALASTLYGAHVVARVAIVAIAIAPSPASRFGLSPEVAAAVEPAAALAAALAAH
jgi:hydrogenase maturation protease